MKKQPKRRNNTRLILPNGCTCSQLTITPRNWEDAGASIDRPWLLSYRFYSPDGVKAVQRRGMNAMDNLKERQKFTRAMIADELDLLESGFNPILEKMIPVHNDDSDGDYVIHPNAPLSQALQKAFDLFEGESKTDLRSSLKYLQKSIANLGLQDKSVASIRKRHLLRILENCGKVKEALGKAWTANQYNHYRTALNSLYKIFVKYETVEHNLVHDIEKKQHVPEPRMIMTEGQRTELDTRLKVENYRFWNFIHIFFHSGARLTEMARLQGKHVDLDRQVATYLVKKGKSWNWVKRPIPDEALPYWNRAVIGCGPEQYVFAKGLLPGDKPIDSAQYTRRWRTWVKTPIKAENKHHPKKGKKKRPTWIPVDLYALKHAHTTMVMDMLDGSGEPEKEAARINGHTTAAMVKKVYDVKYRSRKDEKVKKLPIKLA